MEDRGTGEVVKMDDEVVGEVVVEEEEVEAEGESEGKGEGERVGTREGRSSTLTTALPIPPALARTTANLSCRDRILNKQNMFFPR